MVRLLAFTCANALPQSRADKPVTCTFPASNKAPLVAVIAGIVLLAPLAISMLRASSRLPVAIRIALRDLVRYRARSGAALAATTFAVFLAMSICLVASTKF